MENDNSVNNFYKFKSVHATSTISMSLVLFLIGIVCLLFFVARDLSVFVKENINLSVILEDEITDSYRQRIEKYLKSSDFVKSVDYVSKEDALKEHIESLGEDPQEFLGFNPLMASLEVKLKADYANNDSVKKIESKLSSFENINRIAYQKDVISLINDNITKISIVLLGLALILLTVSLTLINNTVRLAIYSNRFLINTMKLVGATAWFIRKPYIIKGMLNGIIAALISLLMLAGLMYYFQIQFGLTGFMINSISLIYVAFAVIFSGIILTAISSYFAVGKYLRMKTNDMYFI